MEDPIKIDDLGVPLFSETSIYTFLELILHVGTPFRRSEYERSSTIHVNDLPGHVPDTCDADQEIAIIH